MKYLYNTPIIMPRGTHYGSDYWIIYSKKLQRQVHLYSMLEHANFIVLEMDSHVEYFCEQPLKITDINDTRQQSIFDFWVYFTNGTHEFQEVKYSNELTETTESALRSQKQITFQSNWCKKQNHAYRVVTEKDLYQSEYYINNLEILYSFVLRQSTPIITEKENALYKFLMTGSQTISAIEKQAIFSEENIMANLALLYYKGSITIDILNRPLDRKTEIGLCENENIIY